MSHAFEGISSFFCSSRHLEGPTLIFHFSSYVLIDVFSSQRWNFASLHFCPPLHFLRVINHLHHVRPALLTRCESASNAMRRYIIGILDVSVVQGNFNLYRGTAFADSAISFPVVSMVFGIILFFIGELLYVCLLMP